MRTIASAVVFVALAACGGSSDPPGSGTDEWQVLFDGQTLDGWEPRGDATWIVEDGYLTTVPGSGDGFLTTTGEYSDFRVGVDFWVDETANGGVYLRVPVEGTAATPSYEVNIMDSHADWPTGSINGIDRYDGANSVGRWNSFEITIVGDSVSVVLDGEQVAAGKEARVGSGRIALQKLGEGVIRYRNVRVAPL